MKDIARLPSPQLEVRDLRVVLALAKAGSTGRAAALLHLTQPAVSRALLAIEDKLGTSLFARTRQGLSPTPAGERLLSEARGLLIALGDLEARVRAPQPVPMRLSVVCECYTAYHWLPSTLAALRTSMPGVSLRLAVEHTRDPAAALRSGDVDIALLTTARLSDARLVERSLFSDEIVFLLSASHPLVSRQTLTRADLRAHPLITSHTPQAERRWFMRSAFGAARPKLTFEWLPLTEAIVDVTRAGLGIGVLSAWIAAPHLARGDLVAKRLATGPLRRPWRIAYRGEIRTAAERVHAAIAAMVPRSPPF